MTRHHRFTGRDLSSLLEQVREELGTDATILEANKIRTGGVAGFFKTEKFEVVAVNAEDALELDRPMPALQLDLIEPDGRLAPSFAAPATPVEQAAPIDLRTAINDVRAERFADVPDTVDIRTPLPSEGLPPRRPSTSLPSTASATPAADSIPSYFDDPTAAAAAVPPRTPAVDDRPPTTGSDGATALLDRVEAGPTDGNETDRRFGDVLADELRQPDITIRSTETDTFWESLGEIGRAFVAPDLDSRLVTIVGNRGSALALARRIEGSSTVKPALAALSPEPDKLGLPAWQLIDTAVELEDRLRFWDQADRAAMVIIDADLGEDAIPMVSRLRAAGSEVLRLAIDDELPTEKIRSLMDQLGGNVVIDVTFRPPPNYVCSLLDGGVPIASVNGHDLDSGLVLAMRQAAARG